MHLAGRAVDHLDRLSGIIDEKPFAGGMGLPHSRRQAALPLPIELAEPRVAVALRLALAVLLPEQHEGDAGPPQLAIHRRPIRRALAAHAGRRSCLDEEQRVQHRIGQRCRQRPAQARGRGTGRIIAHRTARQPGAAGDRAVARAPLLLQAKDLSDTTHRHSLGWHRPLPGDEEWSLCGNQNESARQPRGGRLQIGIGGRLRLEQVAGFKSESATDFVSEWAADLRRNQQVLRAARSVAEEL